MNRPTFFFVVVDFYVVLVLCVYVVVVVVVVVLLRHFNTNLYLSDSSMTVKFRELDFPIYYSDLFERRDSY